MTPVLCLTGWLYLRTWPNPVFEGDTLTLQCQGWKNTALSQVQFYKDRKLLHNPKAKWFLPMGTATLKSSGQYSCAGKMTFIPHLGTQRSEMTTVQVQGESPALGDGGGGARVLLRNLVSRGQQLPGQQPSLWLPLMPGQPQSSEMSTMLSRCLAPVGHVWRPGKEGGMPGAAEAP